MINQNPQPVPNPERSPNPQPRFAINRDVSFEDRGKIPQIVRNLPDFEGNPRNLSQWILDVEDVLELFDDLKDSFQYHLLIKTIKRKIKGEANDALITSNALMQWESIKEVLKLYYADKRDLMTLDNQLKSLARGRAESIDSYYSRVREPVTVISSAISMDNQWRGHELILMRLYNQISLDTFIRGLGDGQQTATSSFPCPYCFVKLQDLRNRTDINRDGSPMNDKRNEDFPGDHLLERKTYGDLRKDYQEYVSLGRDKKVAHKSRSTIHAPLFVEDDNVPVLQKCIIPELHILQGFVNHLFWTALVPLLGREKALLWPQKLKLVSKNYHGEAFEGNACRTLLKRSDVLLHPEISEHLGSSLSLQPFIAALRAMDEVVHSCFAVRRIQSDLSRHIQDLKTAFRAIDVSETLKIHIALCHIEASLEFLSEDEGFGLWSEQAGESIHREFFKFWNRRKINNLQDPDYLLRLKAAVVDFSSKHV